MTNRQIISSKIETEVLVKSARRCCLCYGLNGDFSEKRGQIAHIDRDPSNSCFENLAYLCLDHHDLYDSKTSQSKEVTRQELIYYRNVLYTDVKENLPRLSDETGSSKHGRLLQFLANIRKDTPYPAPLLNGYEIEQAFKEKLVVIEPFSRKQLGLTAYTLVLGHQAVLGKQLMSLDDKTPLVLKPGEVAVISTQEFISLPLGLLGRILPIQNLAANGLLMTSAALVDPGYRGRLFLALRNVTSVNAVLNLNTEIAMLELVPFNMPPEGWDPYFGFNIMSAFFMKEDNE